MKKKLFVILAEIVILFLGTWLLHIELSTGELNSGLREYRKDEEALPFWYSIFLFAGCLIAILFDVLKSIYMLFKEKR